MSNITHLVGIDPDLDKSGVAIWSLLERKIISYGTDTFYGILTDLPQSGYLSTNTGIIIEAGWLNKISNYHKLDASKGENYRRAVGESIARKVGENHATGKLLAHCFKCMGYAVTLVRPVQHKWDAMDLKRFTGVEAKNQEVIDAIRLVYGR